MQYLVWYEILFSIYIEQPVQLDSQNNITAALRSYYII